MSSQIFKEYQNINTADISDSLGNVSYTSELIAYHQNRKLIACGPALTVKVPAGDNLMIKKAIEQANPGDIIIIDAEGSLERAVVGGMMRDNALNRGVAAFVVDGAVRDLAEWDDAPIGVWAKGHNLRGPCASGQGHINIPIQFEGIKINPGDLIIADADGIVVIPQQQQEALLPIVKGFVNR